MYKTHVNYVEKTEAVSTFCYVHGMCSNINLRAYKQAKPLVIRDIDTAR